MKRLHLHLKYIELHRISKEQLVVLVTAIVHFCYPVSSKGFPSHSSLASVFYGRQVEVKEEGVPRYPVVNPLGVSAFGGLWQDRQGTHLCLVKNEFHGTLSFHV